MTIDAETKAIADKLRYMADLLEEDKEGVFTVVEVFECPIPHSQVVQSFAKKQYETTYICNIQFKRFSVK